jgi:ribosome-binding factor A
MGKLIALKFTPDLRFVEDTSFAEAEKIETLLKSSRVQRDLAAPADNDADNDGGDDGDADEEGGDGA